MNIAKWCFSATKGFFFQLTLHLFLKSVPVQFSFFFFFSPLFFLLSLFLSPGAISGKRCHISCIGIRETQLNENSQVFPRLFFSYVACHFWQKSCPLVHLWEERGFLNVFCLGCSHLKVCLSSTLELAAELPGRLHKSCCNIFVGFITLKNRKASLCF